MRLPGSPCLYETEPKMRSAGEAHDIVRARRFGNPFLTHS